MNRKNLLTTVFALLLAVTPAFATNNTTALACDTIACTTASDSASLELSIIQRVEDWYNNNMNYGTITALMAVESSFIPFPSEIVVPPAAAVSVRPDSNLSIPLIVLFATLGALIGAIINYVLALYLGRAIIYRFADSRLGRLCLLNSDKIRQAEDYFNSHGAVSTFVGRLIPGIRQLISIPAGLARMKMLPFLLYTALGAGIWNIVLALIGYFVGDNMDLIKKYSSEIGHFIVVIVLIVMHYYIFRTIYRRYKARKQKSEQA